jgi:hypothetical protein
LFFDLIFFLINNNIKKNCNLVGIIFLSLSVIYHPPIGISILNYNVYESKITKIRDHKIFQRFYN